MSKKIYCGNCKYYYCHPLVYGYIPPKHICKKLSNFYRDDLYWAFCQLYEKCKNPREFKMEEKAKKNKRRRR